MSDGGERRRRGGRAGVGREVNAIRQPPWRKLANPYPPMEILSAEQLEAIHDTSMRVLEEVGVEFMSPRALDLLAAAGAEVDRASGLVRLDRGLVAEQVAKAPASVTLTPRNPGRAIEIGGRSLVFSLVAGPPNVHDLDRGRRAGNFRDYCDLLRLAQSLEIVHYIGNQVVAPVDLPAESRHLDCYHANLTLTDRCFHATAIGAERALDAIEMMAIARGVTLAEMAASPGVTTVINVNSPRRFDGAMAEGLMAMAEHGQPSIVTPFTLMGAMTPVTLAAALVQSNAEALAGVVLSQLTRPGSPVIYGCFTSNVDLRSGAPAFGTPEYAKAAVAAGQLARRYGLPYRSSNPNAANCVDAQAAYETLMALWGAVLGGANLVYHAAGWLEGGLTASFEKVILDAELLQHVAEFLQPIAVDEDSLGLEAIREVAPGGHFFGSPHTLARYENAFYQPLLSDWRNYESWQEAGAPDATARANSLWKRLLESYEEPVLAPERREALDAYVARRKEAIAREAA